MGVRRPRLSFWGLSYPSLKVLFVSNMHNSTDSIPQNGLPTPTPTKQRLDLSGCLNSRKGFARNIAGGAEWRQKRLYDRSGQFVGCSVTLAPL